MDDLPLFVVLIFPYLNIFIFLLYSGYLVAKESHDIIANNKAKVHNFTAAGFHVDHAQFDIDINTNSRVGYFWLLCIGF